MIGMAWGDLFHGLSVLSAWLAAFVFLGLLEVEPAGARTPTFLVLTIAAVVLGALAEGSAA